MGSGLSKKAEERISTAKKNKSKEINLKDCQLKKLPHVVKTALKGLKILNISQNYIVELPPAIGNFVDLEEFYCDTNEIAELPAELFTLKKLLILNVARNPLSSLPDQYIADLGALTTLDLSGTQIEKLPPNLGKLQSLTTYIHQSCGLSEVPPQILHLKNLRVLDLSINKITTLPVDLDKLVNLERLDLSNNRLSKLETPVAALSNLRALILHNNPLTDVSTFPFGKLGNLIELNMNECHLEKISQEIGTLTKLQTLELAINKLKVIPRQIGHIGTGLRRFNLRSNQIEDVPGEFSFFEPAIDLDLSNNPLRGQQQQWLDQGAPVLVENLAPFTKAWPAHCECTGDSLNTAPAKQGVSFFINAKDFKGRKRTTGNDKFDVLFVRQGSELDAGDSKYYQNEGIVKDLKNGSYVAIKILKHRNVRSSRDYDMIEREKRALVTLDHPNIVKLKEIIENEVKQATYLVFEYVSGGELFGYIVSHGRLSEATARKFVRQIVSALEYCHFNLIVHRDLKPENLLLDQNENIKITDFGLANFITPNHKFSTFCGSLHYAAPEILNGHQYAGPAVDIYALGVILYCLLNGQQPFDADSPIEMMKKIQHGLQFHHDTSKDVRDLITKMMAVDPKKRISMEDIRKHPWILKDFNGPPPTYIPPFERVAQVDEEVMRDLVAVGFEDTPKSREWIVKNKQHAQITSAYQLFLHRRRQMALLRAQTAPQTRSRSQSTSTDCEFRPRRHTEQALDTRGVVVQTRGELKNSKQNSSSGKLDFLEVISEDPKSAPVLTNNNNGDLTTQLNQIITDILTTSGDKRVAQSSPSTPSQLRNNDNRRDWMKDPAVWKNQSCENNIQEKFFANVTARSVTPTPQARREERRSANMQHQSARLPKFNTGRQEPDQSPTSTASSSESEIEVIRTEQKPSPSFKCDTTSSKSTDEIRKQLKTACAKTDIKMKKISRHDYQFVHEKTDVHFELEIVKMKGFKNLKGLKLKRLEGDIWAYKQLVVEFLEKLRL